ncbi:uncharacterized protein FIBRA_01924 [Fibroporia radiculosa]|uniref:Major facilitator superfamily (MFS) profile domain-containing protein n=1 Tax=Fibroporia radiculosa TaxID=599839 RepID=J4H1J0_9APHY|nr:uncharacterized protein FIBRA_01924 [Fibroporia radiculosa]CCL99899.1 predicted protein [Fibroporia radiculosa]
MPSPTSNPGHLEVDKRSVLVVEYAQGQTEGPTPALSLEQQKRLWRKIDVKIMPILTVMYLFSFMDRGNIVLKKIRPSRWLPGITLLWGTIIALMGLVKTYPQLVGTRILLGVTEAGLFPGAIYYMTLWYPRHMLQVRIGVFYGGASLAGAFSGLLAYAISFMSGTAGFLGWSWIFIIEGIATVVIGLVSFFSWSFSVLRLEAKLIINSLPVLVDFPDTATFLTPEERAYVLWTKSKLHDCSVITIHADFLALLEYDNSSVGEEEHFEIRHLISAFTDWQIWLQILNYFSIVTPLYGITIFLPTIINDFGYDTAISQLLTVPPYVFAMIFAVWSDHNKERSPFILYGLLMCQIGFIINITNAPNGAKYFGTFLCVAGSYGALPGVIAWLGNNLSGQYKRAVGMALQIGIGNFGTAIACNVYLSKDAPRYEMGHGIVLMFIAIGWITVPITRFIYARINARRDVLVRELHEKALTCTDDELRRMGDLFNLESQYELPMPQLWQPVVGSRSDVANISNRMCATQVVLEFDGWNRDAGRLDVGIIA